MNCRVSYCCKRFQNLAKRGLPNGKSLNDPNFLSNKNSTLERGLIQFGSTQYSSTSSPETVDYSRDKTTHFGYQTVSEKEKHENVLKVFHNVANSYDVMNDAMSLGIHRLWKNHFVSKLSPNSKMKILDVAGGTGDIAFRILDEMKESITSNDSKTEHGHVTVCDINKSMLEVGKDRAQKLSEYHSSHITWVEGDAQNLKFEDNTFDAYTIAFGIRNVVDIDKAIQEAYRVLKPGGRFLCLEFSHVNNPVMNSIYETYSFEVIPPMGMVLAGDWDSYQYLIESIRKFPTQEEFRQKIRNAGFKLVSYENLTFGVAAIHSGFKL